MLSKLYQTEKVCADPQTLKTAKPWDGTKTRVDVKQRSSRGGVESTEPCGLLCKAQIRGRLATAAKKLAFRFRRN